MGISSITGKRILFSDAESSQWHSMLDRFSRQGLNDVYFYPEYHTLYLHNDDRVVGYSYQAGTDFFFFPFIKRPINQQVSAEPLFDFESAYGYGGPLVTTTNEEFLHSAWSDFSDYCKNERIVAGFIRFHPLLKNHRLLERRPGVSIVYARNVVCMSLPKTQDEVWSHYKESIRTKVRKAQRNHVKVIAGSSKNDLDVFRNLYRETMTRVGAQSFYRFPDSYFDTIASQLKNHYQVFMALHENMAIGAALILLSDHYVHYHLSANLKDYRNFEPATLLRHEVIQTYRDSGRKEMLFGGGRTDDPRDSLLNFKAGFSPQRAEFFIGKIIGHAELYDQLCRKWAADHPDMRDEYKSYVLKYRYTHVE